MRKIGIGAAAAVGLVAVGYVGAWYYGAHEIKSSIAAFTEEVNQKKETPTLSYTSLEISGFPGSYRVVIDKPTLTEKGNTGQNFTLDKMLLTADLLHNSYTLAPVGNIVMNLVMEGEQKKLEAHYKGEALLTLRLKALSSWKEFKEGGNFSREVVEMRYADQGFLLVDSKNAKPMLTAAPTVITMDSPSTAEDQYNLNVHFKLEGLEFDRPYAKMLKLPSKITGEGEIAFAGVKNKDPNAAKSTGIVGSDFEEVSITIPKCTVSGDEAMGISLRGKVGASKKQFMPNGELYLTLEEVNKLLDYFVDINVVKDKAKAKDAFKQMAEAPVKGETNVQNMDFVLKGSVNGITVGKLTLAQAVLLFKQFL